MAYAPQFGRKQRTPSAVPDKVIPPAKRTWPTKDPEKMSGVKVTYRKKRRLETQ